MIRKNSELKGFEPFEDATEFETWLPSAAEFIHGCYNELRNELNSDSESWTYSDYCHRLSYHYYNLAGYYQYLYTKYRVDLNSVRYFLGKAVEKINALTRNQYEIDQQFKTDTFQYFQQVSSICEKYYQAMVRNNDCDINNYLQFKMASGLVDDDVLSEVPLSDEYKNTRKVINSIRLLKTIYRLEEDVSLTDDLNFILLSDQTKRLGLAYRLAGQHVISTKYLNTANYLHEKFLSLEPREPTDYKKLMTNIIKRELDLNKNDLEDIVEIIENEVNTELGFFDRNYIARNYIKHCSQLWLTEMRSVFKQLSNDKKDHIVLGIFHSLDLVLRLSDVHYVFKTSVYYSLLYTHYSLLTEKDEKRIVNKYKTESLQQIETYGELAKKELEFIECFVEFFHTCPLYESLQTQLDMEDFFANEISVNKFIMNVINLPESRFGKEVKRLRNIAKCLKDQDNFFFKDKFQEIIKGCLKPVEIIVQNIDNRIVVEVTGKHLKLADLMDQVKKKFESSKAEEVRFVCSGTLNIDVDFENSFWHGKNIVFIAKVVKILKEVTWDVSGLNNTHEFKNNAGTSGNGYGNPGKDGYPGESGGNVLFLAETIENIQYLTIISNGGKGSCGQDGGNGLDGQNGSGISYVDLKNKFPPPATTILSNCHLVQTSVSSIENHVKCFNTAWYAYKDYYDKSILKEIRNDYVESINEVHALIVLFSGLKDYYIDYTSIEDHQIVLSYTSSRTFGSSAQGFCIYKGSPGKMGAKGGVNGIGGEGGYSGEIEARYIPDKRDVSVNKIRKKGDDGKNGIGGLYGKHGTNGWDMAYTDYQWWSSPVFYGSDQNSRLSLSFHYYSDSNRIFCRYKYNNNENSYAEISSSTLPRPIQRVCEREKTRTDRKRQQYANATKKKNISTSILSNYDANLNYEIGVIASLKSNVNKLREQALQAINELQRQDEQITTEQRKNQILPVQKINKFETKFSILLTENTLNVAGEDWEQTISTLSLSKSVNDWYSLRERELNHYQLREVCLVLNAENCFLNLHVPKDQLEVLKKFFLEKYRLSTLQEINKMLPNMVQNTLLNNSDEIENMHALENYLFEADEVKTEIHEASLGLLDQYIEVEQDQHRENVVKYCRENRENIDKLNLAARHFILQNSCSFVLSQQSTEFLQKYNFFIDKMKKGLVVFQESFELLDRQLCKNDAVFDDFMSFITCCPSLVYMELLAYVFNVSIRIYIEDENKNYKEVAVYDPFWPGKMAGKNPSRYLYFLLRKGVFVQLNVDANYLTLDQNYCIKDKYYKRILVEVDKLTSTFDLDTYLRKKPFESGNNVARKEKLIKQLLLMTNASINDEDTIRDQQDLEEIVKHFADDLKPLIQKRLKIVSNKFSGQSSVLYSIHRRFSCDGIQISVKEILYLVDFLLSYVCEDWMGQSVVAWITASYPQDQWTDQFILIKIERHLRKLLDNENKITWSGYLRKIQNKDILLLFSVKLDESRGVLPVQCVQDTLYLLSEITHATLNLDGIDLLEWPYALKEKFWNCRISTRLNLKADDLETVCYYALSLENRYGEKLLDQLITGLGRDNMNMTPDKTIRIFANFCTENWILDIFAVDSLRENPDVDKWIENMSERFVTNLEDREISVLVDLIKSNHNSSKNVISLLDRVESDIIRMNKPRQSHDLQQEEYYIREWAKDFKSNVTESKLGKEETVTDMLQVIDRAILLRKGFGLRDTQKLAVLILLRNSSSTLEQVSTGEGKSLIVVTASLVKALYGEKVHIVTSSTVLAKRDAEINKSIYELFGVNVSHNCNEDVEKRREAYLRNQVIYGDLSNFQRDYLLDRFYGKNIFGDHNFENIMVDEVDSMLLDKGNNMLYLSHDLPGLDSLESVFIFIWQIINKPANTLDDIIQIFDSGFVKDAVIYDLWGLIKKEDISQLDYQMSQDDVNEIWGFLSKPTKKQVINDKGILLEEELGVTDLKEKLTPKFERYAHRLHFYLTELKERPRNIHIPEFLKPFVEQHLEAWIESAKSAFFMKPGKDYVVDVDRTGTKADRNPNITILDRETGTDQGNSQWDEALHQFLQLKHGCKVSLLSLKAVFVSNVSYFKLYNKMYGLTGTLGSQRERDLLQSIHKVDFVTIPTAKSKQFLEFSPIVCKSKEEWVDLIFHLTNDIINQDERSTLVICETVNDVELLHEAFGGKNAGHVYTYTRDFEEFDIAQGNKKLEQGCVIIATNLAGRGTDIRLSDELRNAGGLHVCLTFLPSNIRIEEQAFGRAARSGDRGSGQLVIIDSSGHEYSTLKMLELKKERDIEELVRISGVKVYYETQITTEEKYFSKYSKEYEKLVKLSEANLNQYSKKDELTAILLQCILDKWALWLDSNCKAIEKVDDAGKKKNIDDSFKNFLSVLSQLKVDTIHDLKSWVEGNPCQELKLAKFLADNGEPKEANQFLKNLIARERNFLESAHYYRAYALSKIINWESQPLHKDDQRLFQEFKLELSEAADCFKKRIQFSIYTTSIIRNIESNNNECLINTDAYEKQQKNFVSLYSLFTKNIDDILGHMVTPQTFEREGTVLSPQVSRNIFDALIDEGVLEKLKVNKEIRESEVNDICSSYCIASQTLTKFLHDRKGHSIDEITFTKDLKRSIPLPSKEEFWKVLKQQNILIEEIKYVVVNDKDLTEEFQRLDLKDERLDSDSGIYIYPDLKSDIKGQKCFDKVNFKRAVGNERYKKLKRQGFFSFNKKARIQEDMIEFAEFPCFDSITLNDFEKVNICESDARIILKDLLDANVLIKDDKNDEYRLQITFDKLSDIELKSCPIYEGAAKSLISICFLYRLSLQKLENQIKDRTPVKINIMSKPENYLFSELIDRNIVKPVKVAKKDKDTVNDTVTQVLKKFNIENLDIIKLVVSSVEQSKSILAAFEVPSFSLKSLVDFLGSGEYGNIEEVLVLLLNGSDQLIQAEEKKWTLKMIFSTLLVVALGLCQIAIGAVIGIYSCQLAQAFINEGVGDLIFAVGCFKSGYFSWKEYGNHKLFSLLTTVICAGVGSFLSRGHQVSRYGKKLAGPNLNMGKPVSQMVGSELVKTVGLKNIGKEVAKCITLKFAEGVAIGIAHAGVDLIIENAVQNFCDSVSSEILADMERSIEVHDKLPSALRDAYNKLGYKGAKSLIEQLSDTLFDKDTYTDIMKSMNKSIMDGMYQGFAGAPNVSNKLSLTLEVLNKILVWGDRLRHLAKLFTITSDCLDSLSAKINKILVDNKQNSQEKSEKSFETFQAETAMRLKEIVKRNAGGIISQNLVSPLMKSASSRLVKYAGKAIKKGYRAFKEHRYSKEYQRLKQNNQDLLLQSDKTSTESKTDLSALITEKHSKGLIKLLAKTKSPELFAEIVRENIPMDLTCVDACMIVIQNMFIEKGIDHGLIVIVEGENNLQKEVGFSGKSDSVHVVHLSLKDNHFQLSSNNCLDTVNSAHDSNSNDCLFESLSIIPELKNVSSEEFRNDIATVIETDPNIRYHIQQGWHKFPISRGIHGGRQSSKKDQPEFFNRLFRSSAEGNVVSVEEHLHARLFGLFVLHGSVERYSEQTGIDKENILEGGASQFQDQSSGLGSQGIEASHINRARIANTFATENDLRNGTALPQAMELKNMLGTTQNVEKWANYFHGIGGEIDKFQSDNATLNKLFNINFRSHTLEDASNIINIQNSYIKVLDGYKARETNGEYIKQIERVQKVISCTPPQVYFNYGRIGYKGSFTKDFKLNNRRLSYSG